MKKLKNSDFSYIFNQIDVKNREESIFLEEIIKNLGQFTTVKELAAFLKVSKSFIYANLNEENLIYFKISSRYLIYTKSVLAILR